MKSARVRPRLGIEIAALLVAKLILLTCLYFAFFNHGPRVDGAALSSHLLNSGH